MTAWDDREGPILAAIAEADAKAERPDSGDLAGLTGLSPEQVAHGLETLVEAGYATGHDVTTFDSVGTEYMDLRLTKTGREAVGTWNAPRPATGGEGAGVIVEVLIASPSDVTEERDRVERAIHDWNGLHAVDEGVVLLPRRWERDAVAAMGESAQAVLNAQIVDRSRILIGVFWTRLGTPTWDADSGTAEEIGRFIDAGKPVHLYFSNRPIPPDSIDAAQHESLKAYKAGLGAGGLLGQFADLDELARQVTAALTLDVKALAKAAPAPEQVPMAKARLEVVQVPSDGSNARFEVRSVGPVAAEDVEVILDGALFMLDADGERILPGTPSEIGRLTPGSMRAYDVLRAAQTTRGRVLVTASGLEPIKLDLS